MKRHFIEAEVVSVEQVAQATALLGLKAVEIARQVKPGQFVMVGPPNQNTDDPFLNRPFSVHGCDQETTMTGLASCRLPMLTLISGVCEADEFIVRRPLLLKKPALPYIPAGRFRR